jgi:hypothetical protein
MSRSRLFTIYYLRFTSVPRAEGKCFADSGCEDALLPIDINGANESDPRVQRFSDSCR